MNAIRPPRARVAGLLILLLLALPRCLPIAEKEGFGVWFTFAGAGAYGRSEGYRRTITIRNGSYGEEFLNFPLLIRLNSTRIRYSAAEQGDRLWFEDADGSVLDHEVELWNAAGESIVWVRVPRIAASSDTGRIVMNYGASAPATGPTSVWSDFAGVWHLNNTPDGSGSEILDSSGNTHHGTAAGGMSAANYTTSGAAIGGAITFDGTDDRVEIPHATDLSFSSVNDLTLSLYVNEGTLSSSLTGLVTKSRDIGNWYGFWISNTDFWQAGSNVSSFTTTPNSAVTGWVHLVHVQNTGTGWRRIYVNGVERGSSMTIVDMAGTGDLWFGGAKSQTEYFSGSLDEVRISRSARSQAYIQAEYANLTDTYLDFGAEETN